MLQKIVNYLKIEKDIKMQITFALCYTKEEKFAQKIKTCTKNLKMKEGKNFVLLSQKQLNYCIRNERGIFFSNQ